NLLAARAIGMKGGAGRGSRFADEDTDLAGRPTDVLPVGDHPGEDLRDLVLRQRLDRIRRSHGDRGPARADRQRLDLALLGILQVAADVAEIGLAADREVHSGIVTAVGEALPGVA